MTFKELMLQLHEVKKEAVKNGLKPEEIANLVVIDVGLLGSIEKKDFEVTLAKHKMSHYLLMKLKK